MNARRCRPWRSVPTTGRQSEARPRIEPAEHRREACQHLQYRRRASVRTLDELEVWM